MSRFGGPTRCTGCGEPLGEKSCRAWKDERTPWSDEYVDELHECPQWGAWTKVTHLERFTGLETTTTQGPLPPEEARSQMQKYRGFGP